MAIFAAGAILCLVVALGAPGCGSAPTAEAPVEPAKGVTEVTIEEAQKTLTEELMKLPGVVGSGIGLCGDDPCIKVYLTQRTPELKEKIPASFQGYPVAVQVSGEIKARPPREF